MKTPEQRAMAQGHLTAEQRPQCSNCWAHVEKTGQCGLGDFATTCTSWCALWIPQTEWANQHPAACKAMGLSGGSISAEVPFSTTHPATA